MDKVITTALLIVISMIMAIVLFNAAYPAITEGSAALVNMASRSEDRLRTQVEVIHIASEHDGLGGWDDANANGLFDTSIWVKNVGSTRITAIESVDIFYGPEAAFERIPHEDEAGGSFPYWTWIIEQGTEWTPTATLRIAIHTDTVPATGRYTFKLTLPNGLQVDYTAGM